MGVVSLIVGVITTILQLALILEEVKAQLASRSKTLTVVVVAVAVVKGTKLVKLPKLLLSVAESLIVTVKAVEATSPAVFKPVTKVAVDEASKPLLEQSKVKFANVAKPVTKGANLYVVLFKFNVKSVIRAFLLVSNVAKSTFPAATVVTPVQLIVNFFNLPPAAATSTAVKQAFTSAGVEEVKFNSIKIKSVAEQAETAAASAVLTKQASKAAQLDT